jgi:hypothetical protein
MFDDIFSGMFDSGGSGYDIWGDGGSTFSGSGDFGSYFGGDESSVGITDIMGMPAPTYGDWGGGSVFDAGGTGLWDSGTFADDIGSNPYGYSDYSGGITGSSGGPDWMSRMGSLLTGQNLGSVARLLGQGLSIGSGINALSQGRQLANQARDADPMQPYRAGWAARLNALLADPSSITSDPGYAAALEAVKRGGAATGNFASGGMVGDLAQFGVQFYDRAIDRLGRLVGGTPGGAMPGTQAGINLTNAGMNRIGAGIASLATGLEGD